MEKGDFNAAKAAKFDNEGRLAELRPYQLLNDRGGISCGMTCVDIGSGTGTFTVPISDCVGKDGIVYAIDNSEAMVKHILARTSASNLITIHADACNTGLESNIADLCLMAFILHEVDKPEKVVAEAARLLKRGGTALVVEWRADTDVKGPPKSVRLTRDRIANLLRQTGLTPLDYVNWSVNHCVATATKQYILSLYNAITR
jgi:ubiquinone/menaquinone biosynthesis C-methylase UbiE